MAVRTSNNILLKIYLIIQFILLFQGRLPNTVYYQIDGGAENVAKGVFLICELLVSRRLTKKVVLSRLMVGHTHCDVDAKFGQLWVSLRVRHNEY